VTEQLATLESVEHALVEHDLDAPAAHHPEVLDWSGTLGEDCRPGNVELDIDRARNARQFGSVNDIERRVRREEVRDVGEGRDASHFGNERSANKTLRR
jgi:hypothetical protein